MSETNTPKALVCAPLIKFYKIFLRFALGPLVSEILKNNVFFQLAFGLTNFHGSLINLSRE